MKGKGTGGIAREKGTQREREKKKKAIRSFSSLLLWICYLLILTTHTHTHTHIYIYIYIYICIHIFSPSLSNFLPLLHSLPSPSHSLQTDEDQAQAFKRRRTEGFGTADAMEVRRKGV